MKNTLSLIVLLFILLSSTLVSAQNSTSTNEERESEIDSCEADHNRWYVGGMLGVYQFYGDISENNFFTGGAEYGYLNGMFGLKVGRNFNQNFGAQAFFNMGSMSSSKKDQWFNAQVRNLGLDFTMNITNIVAPYKFNKKWNVIMFLGAGFMGYRSILYNGANNDSILDFYGYDANGNKESLIYKSFFNIGTNVSYKISNKFDIFFEVNFTSTPMDNLDAKPVTLSELDSYGHTTLGLHYTFGKHDLAYKWNPKPCYFAQVEDEVYKNEQDIVDLGNRIDTLEKCCSERNMIDPCDTSTVDTDGDAVPDCRDLEEDSPKGSIVNFQGIALVVKDSTYDDAPGQGGAMQRQASAPAIFFSPIFFEYDKTVIDSTGEYALINVALYMKQYPDVKMLISGNCDSRASDTYNDDLSKRRCNKARKVLVKEYGIDNSRFEVQPNGKRSLLFPKHHANRRVDFSVL